MPFSSVSLLSLDPTAYLGRVAGQRTPPPPRLRRVVLRAASVSAVAEESSAAAAAAARGRLESLSQVAGVLGTQWGDEGKGKLVDILAQRFDVVARCQVAAALCLSNLDAVR
jgi:adenylosuccinate synthase